MEHIATCCGNYPFDLQRVTVMLGVNGSGKSKLLREITKSFGTAGSPGKAVYVEGGRAITLPDTIQPLRQGPGPGRRPQTYEEALAQYHGKRGASLMNRIRDRLATFVQEKQKLRDEHADAVYKWETEGRQGYPPRRGKPALERLTTQFNEIFPHLHLDPSASDGKFLITNDRADRWDPLESTCRHASLSIL